MDEIFGLLEDGGKRFCVTGGRAVNAYVEPLVSLDLDLEVAVDPIAEARKPLKERFEVEVFPRSNNISSAGSNIRVQIHTDPRYSDCVRSWPEMGQA